MDRRTFLRNIAGYGVASLTGPMASVFAREFSAPSFFSLHPFIEAHPEAVFIRKTKVGSTRDSEAKRREALTLARRIFTLREVPGVPLTHKFAFKPNLTSARGSGTNHAIVTDAYVTEGFVDGLKQLNINPGNIYLREGLMVSQPGTGFIELAERSGTHYGDGDSRTPTTKECPDGVVFRRTKYLGPFNHPDSYLINISKFKTHAMGLTLCVKNLQGTNIQPYIRFCGGVLKTIGQDFQADAEQHIEDLYNRHNQAGMPRWDTAKGPWMEMWIQRTIDHYPLIKPTVGLNIIEAVYGQNGDGFSSGPSTDGLPDIFLTNMLIFGKDAFRVDIIGHWLGGHEPGNFGLFHIGRERGVSTALNPRNIPVYLWEDDGPKLTPLDKLTRTSLSTPYLTKSGEARFHLCDEPFSYPKEPVSACLSGRETPGVRVLGSHRPALAGSSVEIEYNLPADGYASVEVYNSAGEPIENLAGGQMSKGVHLASWNTQRRASGTYYCRLKGNGFDRLEPIGLVV